MDPLRSHLKLQAANRLRKTTTSEVTLGEIVLFPRGGIAQS